MLRKVACYDVLFSTLKQMVQYPAQCMTLGGSPIYSLVRLEEGADAFLAGSLKLGGLGSVLEDLEGGHALNTTGLRDVGGGVHVNLAEGPASVRRLAGDSLEDGADALARRAPGSSEVDDHGLLGGAGLEDLEFGNVSDVLNFRHGDCVLFG